MPKKKSSNDNQNPGKKTIESTLAMYNNFENGYL